MPSLKELRVDLSRHLMTQRIKDAIVRKKRSDQPRSGGKNSHWPGILTEVVSSVGGGSPSVRHLVQ